MPIKCVWCGADKLKDGFECPKEVAVDPQGQPVAHPKYAHPTDCQRFYVCLNGKEPRDLGCQVGEVYNEESQRCDAPENVPGWSVFKKLRNQYPNTPNNNRRIFGYVEYVLVHFTGQPLKVYI